MTDDEEEEEEVVPVVAEEDGVNEEERATRREEGSQTRSGRLRLPKASLSWSERGLKTGCASMKEIA